MQQQMPPALTRKQLALLRRTAETSGRVPQAANPRQNPLLGQLLAAIRNRPVLQPPAMRARPRAPPRLSVTNSRGDGPLSRGNGPNFPKVANRGAGGPLYEDITFDEFVADINGSVLFTATKFPVQPGLVLPFPKGSIKAALYSEWRMKYCEFYYKPEVSGFATQGSGGKVILAMDYNAGNPAPTTKQQVEIMHRVDDMPYEKMALRLDANAVNRSDAKYIRTGPIPPDEDIKTFDGGNLWVCTIGEANANLVGELHVRYCFTCSKPTLLNPTQGSLPTPSTVSFFQSASAQAAGATTVATKILAATASTNGLAVVNTSGSFVPPAGNYLVDAEITYASTGQLNISAVVDIQKNAATLFASSALRPWTSPGTGDDGLSHGTVSASQYVVCNGTDAITIPVTLTYVSDTMSFWGTVRFISV
jgi:hypothetical protein